MDDPDAVFNFLGIRNYVDPAQVFLGADEIGVTTAENWPYRGPDDIDPPPLPLPREVPDWESFRLDQVESFDEMYDPSSPDFEDVINSLISKLKSDGPFITWYPVRSTHKDARNIFTREGYPTGPTHAVAVTGWKKWRINGDLVSYWSISTATAWVRGEMDLEGLHLMR